MAIPRSAPALLPRTREHRARASSRTGAHHAPHRRGHRLHHEWRRVTSGTPDAVEDLDGVFLYLRDEDDGARLVRRPRADARARPTATRPGRRRAACASSAASTGSRRRARSSSRPTPTPICAACGSQPRPRRAASRVTSYAGLVLFHPGGHAGHPAFSKLFVQTAPTPPRGCCSHAGGRGARRPSRSTSPTPSSARAPRASRPTGRASSGAAARSRAPPRSSPAPRSRGRRERARPRRELAAGVTLAPGESVELLCVLALGASDAEARARRAALAGPVRFDAARAGAERRARAELERCGLDAGAGRVPAGAPRRDALRRAVAARSRRRCSAARAARPTISGSSACRPTAARRRRGRAGRAGAPSSGARRVLVGLGVPVRASRSARWRRPATPSAFAKPDARAARLDAARACARLVLRDAWPRLAPGRVPLRARVPASAAGDAGAERRPSELRFANGLGGFSPDGREYVIHVDGADGGRSRRCPG